METILAQTNSAKLKEQDFDRVLDFCEKFFNSVIFQDIEERKNKLFEMFEKMFELEKSKHSKIRAIDPEKVVAKRQKSNSIEIPHVPDEIWLKILNFMESQTIFANFALLCKKFHKLTLDSRAVKNIKLYNINSHEQYENALKVLIRSKNLSRLQIEYSSTAYCSSFITRAFISNPKLKSLFVNTESKSKNWFKLTNGNKKVFGKNLETLALGTLAFDNSQNEITKEIFSQKNLKTLQLSYNYYESNTVMKNFLNLLPKNCKKLSHVNFGHMVCDDVTRIASNFDNFFEEVKENLKTFKCDQVYFTDGSPYPAWERILKNLSLCQKLQVLEIFDATFISNPTLTMISNLPNLKRLTLTKIGSMSNSTEFGTLFQKMNLEKLEYLHLEGRYFLPHKALQSLSNRTPPNLKEIWIYAISNLKLQESTLKNLMDCPKLKKVGLKWSNLDGISTYQLQEFNKNIALFINHEGTWKKFDDLVLEFTIHRTISHFN